MLNIQYMLNAKKGRIANNLLSNYLLMRRYNPLKLLTKKLNIWCIFSCHQHLNMFVVG